VLDVRCELRDEVERTGAEGGWIDYVSVAGATRRFAELVGNDKNLAATVERATERLNNE
jgi:hypothetical protein